MQRRSFLVSLLGAASGCAGPTAERQRDAISAPLRLDFDIPYVEARVNGSAPLWFIVDSGANRSVLDAGLAREFGIATYGSYVGRGAGAGTYEVNFADNVSLSVAGAEHIASPIQAIDLSGVQGPFGRLPGLLGHDFFAAHCVTLDYARARIEIRPRGSLDLAGQPSVPLIFKNDLPRLPFIRGSLSVAGEAPAEREWLVDSGSGDALNDELIANAEDRREATGGVGLGQTFQVLQGAARTVQIGPHRFCNVPASTGGSKIGGGLLRNFIVTFDYEQNYLGLRPNADYRTC